MKPTTKILSGLMLIAPALLLTLLSPMTQAQNSTAKDKAKASHEALLAHYSPEKSAKTAINGLTNTQRTDKLDDTHYLFQIHIGMDTVKVYTEYDQNTQRWTIIRASLEDKTLPPSADTSPYPIPLTITSMNAHPDDNTQPFIAPLLDPPATTSPFYPNMIPKSDNSQASAEYAAREFVYQSYVHTIKTRRKDYDNVAMKMQVGALQCDITEKPTSHDGWLITSLTCTKPTST